MSYIHSIGNEIITTLKHRDMNYKQIAKQNTQNLDNYILKNWGDFGSFHKDVEAGCMITLPIDCIVPRSSNEFDNADEKSSMTNSVIELTFSKFERSEENRQAELVIRDGHNRYKAAISHGLKTLTCIVN